MPRRALVEPSAAAMTVTVADDDTVVGTATAGHDPHDPVSWDGSFRQTLTEAADGNTELAAIAVAAVPGVVVLDAARRAVWVGHPGDVDTSADAGWLAGQLADGVDGWIGAIGRPPAAEDAISTLSWLHRSEPAVWARLGLGRRRADPAGPGRSGRHVGRRARRRRVTVPGGSSVMIRRCRRTARSSSPRCRQVP